MESAARSRTSRKYSGELLAAEQALGEALAVVELAGTERPVELARTWALVLRLEVADLRFSLGKRRVKGEKELFGDSAVRA